MMRDGLDLHLETRIPAKPELVFELLADGEGLRSWLDEIEEWEGPDECGDPVGLPVSARLRMGREVESFEGRVVGHEAPWHRSLALENWRMSVSLSFDLEDRRPRSRASHVPPADTCLELSVHVELRSWALRVIGAEVERKMAASLHQAVERLRRRFALEGDERQSGS